VLASALEVNLQALRDRAPEHPALHRMAEVATLLTGEPDAAAENGIVWLQELTAALSIPGLASYGLSEDGIPAVVTAAQNASSMRGNPIELSDAEVTEIVTRSL
jgi:alcohol dehydrogenase class IV